MSDMAFGFFVGFACGMVATATVGFIWLTLFDRAARR